MSLYTSLARLNVLSEVPEIEVLDCTPQQLGWSEIRRKIESFNPDIKSDDILLLAGGFKAVTTLINQILAKQ